MSPNVFGAMAQDLTIDNNQKLKLISDKQYQAWKQGYLFDAICNLRYGQSFCNTFNITDNILFYEQDAAWADEYIQDYYLDQHYC